MSECGGKDNCNQCKAVQAAMSDSNIKALEDRVLLALSKMYLHERCEAVLALLEEECNKARLDENESLLSVAEHEIELGDKCYNHEKHTPQCHACRKRKMYVEYSRDWKKSIDERIAGLNIKSAVPKPESEKG